MITLPNGDSLGNDNNDEEYIISQLSILQKQMKGWKQAPNESTVLGNNLATGVMISYEFVLPDNIRLYQKQAILPWIWKI